MSYNLKGLAHQPVSEPVSPHAASASQPASEPVSPHLAPLFEPVTPPVEFPVPLSERSQFSIKELQNQYRSQSAVPPPPPPGPLVPLSEQSQFSIKQLRNQYLSQSPVKDLPSGWKSTINKTSGKPYYYSNDNFTTWERPDTSGNFEGVYLWTPGNGGGAGSMTALQNRGLPNGWRSTQNKSGTTYYVKADGTRSSFKPDKTLRNGWFSTQNNSGKTYYFKEDNTVSLIRPDITLPNGWFSAQNSLGRTYYVDDNLKTQWTIPSEPSRRQGGRIKTKKHKRKNKKIKSRRKKY